MYIQVVIHSYTLHVQLAPTLAALVILLCSSLSLVVAASESPRLLKHDDNCSSKFSKSSSAYGKQDTNMAMIK